MTHEETPREPQDDAPPPSMRAEAGGREYRRAWRRPVVTRFSLERTLAGTGSGGDGFGPTSF